MSSGDRINYQQLQMFMPAKQLIDLPFYEADREWIEAETEEYIDVDGITHVEGGGDYPEDDDQFWERKLDESYGYSHDFEARRPFQSLHDDIKESGQVKVPVKLTIEDTNLGTLSRVRQGHHRVAASVDINPDMEVPVRYVNDWGQAMPNDPTLLE